MKWSTLQTDIFNFVEFDSGNAIIEAVAGSGKTTTIVEAINRVPSTQSAIFLAFNKSIADELKARGVNAKTFHSLCCGAAMRALNANNVSADKSMKMMRDHFSEDENFKYASFVTRLVGLGKQVGVGCLVPDTQQVWYDIIDHHDLELEKEDTSITRAMEIASELLTLSNSSNMIDFDDMLYIPVLKGLSLPKFYFIFVDEAQDTNAIQRAILRKIMGPRSRMVAVGDPAQAIYGFRGADSNSLNRIQKEFGCKRFPLSVSYRCDAAIVEYARNWVDHIQARPDAAAGEVRHMNYEWDVNVFTPEDLVVCRTTRPLIALAFKMLRARIPVTVMGREIGQGLVKLIRKFKTNEISVLETKIEWWAQRETEKAVAKMDESKAAAIEDKAQCLLMLAGEIGEEGGDVQALINTIEELFTPTRNSTTLATIHKAKGLEADTVYWLNSSQCPSKWARQHWQKVQEANLCYVATTRAKSLLCLIEMRD
jgi:superfamily I DNA/RNA helicase